MKRIFLATGEGPSPEEVLTAVRVSDSKIALKSGYGKYLGVTANGKVVGRAEAIGSLEQWEPVFEEVNVFFLISMSWLIDCPVDWLIDCSFLGLIDWLIGVHLCLFFQILFIGQIGACRGKPVFSDLQKWGRSHGHQHFRGPGWNHQGTIGSSVKTSLRILCMFMCMCMRMCMFTWTGFIVLLCFIFHL